MPRTVTLILSALLALAALGQPGSSPAPPVGSGSGSGSNLVLVRFQMTPKSGKSADLRPEEIQLTEDGVTQEAAFVQGGPANPLTVPVEVHLLFDDFRESEARVGPWWLRDQPLDLGSFDDRGRVSVAIWTVGDNLVRLTPPTRDPGALKEAVDGLWKKWAEIPLNAPAMTVPFNRSVAALAGALALNRADAIRVIVPLTASCDSEEKQSADTIRRAGLPVFPVWFRNQASFGEANASLRAPLSEYEQGRRRLQGPDEARWHPSPNRCYTYGLDYALASVAGKTGGRSLYLSVMSHNSYGQFIEWLRDQIRADYVVGFYPAASGGQKAHRVRVALKNPARGKIAGGEQTVTH